MSEKTMVADVGLVKMARSVLRCLVFTLAMLARNASVRKHLAQAPRPAV